MLLEKRLFICLISATVLCIFWLHFVLLTKYNNIYSSFDRENNSPKEFGVIKAVHLDFKGGTLTNSFINNLIRILPLSGCNYLIVEYEDMFPYEDFLSIITSKAAYHLSEIEKFTTRAQKRNIGVIPYIPILNNLEFILKIKKFQNLREFHPLPQVISPSVNSSRVIIKSLIHQILNVHKNSNYIILGSEEIDLCPKCVSNNFEVFLKKYVFEIVDWIKNTFPNVTVVLSDWMITKQLIVDYQVESMISCTSRNKEIKFKNKSIKKIWIGGVFRGYSKRNRLFPDLDNTLSVQKSCMNRFKNLNIKGYILMGKSRKDHFSTLTELLPVSIPSLIINLLYISNQQRTHKLQKILDCTDLNNNVMHHCLFPGYDLTKELINFKNLKNEIMTSVQYFEQQGWFTNYNIDYNLTNPINLIKNTPKINSLTKKIRKMKNLLYSLLWKYMDVYSTHEWIQQNVEPLEKSLKRVLEDIDKLLKRKTWPVRQLKKKLR